MFCAGLRKLPSELCGGGVVVALSVSMVFSSSQARADEPEPVLREAVVLRDDGGTCREPAIQSRELKLRKPLAAIADVARKDWLVPPMLMRPADDREDSDPAPVGTKRAVSYSLTDGVSAGVSYSRARLFENASSAEARTRASRFGGLSTGRNRDVLDLGMDWGIGDNSSVGIAYQLNSTRPGKSPGSQSGATSSILPGSEGVDHAVTFGVRRSWGGED